ncbi:uncharacterized protein RHOBADRAFT_45553 [Rhodotorula graminis WP1]|uniref:F-box domain-containing protein n=1 Tax=Rhodotorula graminis (strain WP1) TaxID=578459 RepID=A0A0P9EJ77_RHOGW|nr:uncharacterized protein RHOBADRAFT_45553 [Rhodotorula graminis WP1]KPV73592.1 hypothetical protein RHOBADRAFT_45553 [Rhodotorula graminis WP1]
MPFTLRSASSRAVEPSAPDVSSNIQPRRVPEDVVFKVIECCDDLAHNRTATLLSLCRLSKRYRPLAESLLYSHVSLCAYNGVRSGTALHTLLWYPRLRASVKSVKLGLDDAALVQEPAIALLLGDLHNVDAIETDYIGMALLKLLSSPRVRIRRFKTWPGRASVLSPREKSTRLSLAVDEHLDPGLFGPLTAPFVHQLVGLRLPLWHDLAGLNLGACYRLEHLTFAVSPIRGAAPYDSVFQAAVVALGVASSLPFLKSFAVSGTLSVFNPMRSASLDRFEPMRPHQVAPTAKTLLYAIPRQIQHISLVTNAFHPADVAVYLMSSYRPAGLRTLRVGDEVGHGLGEIRRDETGPHGGLRAALEAAAVEVTTVA